MPPHVLPLATRFGRGVRAFAAVGDATHAMVMTVEGGRPGGTVTGATVVDTSTGKTSPVSLPPIIDPSLLPRPDGYVVGGARCLAATEGPEVECIDWIPTVIFLAADGAVDKVVAGDEQSHSAAMDPLEAVVGDHALVRLGAQWQLWGPTATTPIRDPPHGAQLCAFWDGTIVASVDRSTSSDPNRYDDVPGKVLLYALREGTWTPFASPILYGNAGVDDTAVRVCVPGGLVMGQGTVTGRSGLEPYPSGSAAGGGTKSRDASSNESNADGIDAFGNVYVNSSKGTTPEVVGPSPVASAIVAGDRWVGVGSGGHLAVLGGPTSSTRILSVDP